MLGADVAGGPVKTEEGSTGQGTQVATGSWKKLGKESSPRCPGETSPADTLTLVQGI